jgi:hypothetical protein
MTITVETATDITDRADEVHARKDVRVYDDRPPQSTID